MRLPSLPTDGGWWIPASTSKFDGVSECGSPDAARARVAAIRQSASLAVTLPAGHALSVLRYSRGWMDQLPCARTSLMTWRGTPFSKSEGVHVPHVTATPLPPGLLLLQVRSSQDGPGERFWVVLSLQVHPLATPLSYTP